MATINICEPKKDKTLKQLEKDVKRTESVQELYNRINKYLEKKGKNKVSITSSNNPIIAHLTTRIRRFSTLFK